MTGIEAAAARPTSSAWAVVIAAIFAATLAAIAIHPLRINGDSALHIEAAERILDGGLPHVDAIDTNPPLIMYLTAGPTAVARLLGLHPVPVFLLFAWVFTVACTFWSRRLLVTMLPPRDAIHADLLGVGLAMASLILLRRYEFGQREHLFIFGVLPFVMVRFRRWHQVPTPPLAAVAAGVVAGMAASIKPQLALIVIAPEMLWLATTRLGRPLLAVEVVAAAGAALLYLAHFLVVPAVSEAYFGRWVPLLLSGFAAYNSTLESVMVLRHAQWQLAVMALVPFAWRARDAGLAWTLARPLAAATLAAVAVYALQMKGWPYHAVPITVLVCALSSLMLAQLVTRIWQREPPLSAARASYGRAVLIAIAALAVIGAPFIIGSSMRADADQLVATLPLAGVIESQSREGDPVLVLSTSAWDPYPLLVQLRRRQASRTLFAFPVALLYYGRAAGSPTPPEETRYLDELRADVARHRPVVVAIDTTKPCYGCPPGFSLSEYFERNGFVNAALQGYERSANADRYAIYLRR